MTRVLTSTHNPLVKEIRALTQLRHPQDRRRLVVEGLRMIEEVLDAKVPVDVLLYDPHLKEDERGGQVLDRAQRAQVRIVPALPRVIAACSQVKTPQGLIAVVRIPQGALPAILGMSRPFLVIADRLQDPGNLGTLIRVADAAGVTAVAITPDTVDPYHPKVLRATMGSIFHLPVIRVESGEAIRAFQERGVRLLTADPKGLLEYTQADYHPPVAIVVGNETRGPADEWLEAAAARVRIPLYGRAESLNAAVAAGILLYEARRHFH